MARKFTMSLPETMYQALEIERKKRKLDTIQESIRSVLSEYFRERNRNRFKENG